MDWKTYQKKRQQKRAGNRQEAADGFKDADELAQRHNLTLIQRSQVHYQLRALKEGWLWNLYPGNQRIYADKTRRGPFLCVSRPWTLKDIVEAVIARQKERRH